MPAPERELPFLHHGGNQSTVKRSDLEPIIASPPPPTASELLTAMAEVVVTFGESMDTVNEMAGQMKPVLVDKRAPSLTILDRLKGLEMTGMNEGAMGELETHLYDKLPETLDRALIQYRGNY